MAHDLNGKVVMITGAAGNVGRAVVKAFAAAGARIALVDRFADPLADVLADLGSDSARFKGFPADLGDEEAVDTLIAHVMDQFGHIDALVHTVGGFASGTPVHESGLDVFDKMMALNARVLYLLCGKVAKHMVDNVVQGSISAIVARSALKGSANQAAYTASKAAALRIVESMALELRDKGIRVNAISPSIVDTPPNRQSMPNADPAKWVKPEEIGDLMVFLASDQASAITGAHIEINARS